MKEWKDAGNSSGSNKKSPKLKIRSPQQKKAHNRNIKSKTLAQEKKFATTIMATTISSSHIACACHGNNEAIGHLESGDYATAAPTLASALKYITMALQQQKHQQQQQQLHRTVNSNSDPKDCGDHHHQEVHLRDSPTNGSVKAEPSSLLCSTRRTRDDGGSNTCSSTSQKMDHETTRRVHNGAVVSTNHDSQAQQLPPAEKYMYKHGLRIIVADVVQDEQMMAAETLNEISMILVFNLALVYHLNALNYEDQEISTRVTSLQKARNLYEHAYHLLVSSHDYVDGTRSMALLNNLALVYVELDCQSHAERCWRLLMSMVVYVTHANPHRDNDDDDTTTSGTSSDKSSLSGFIGNVLHLLLASSKLHVLSPAA